MSLQEKLRVVLGSLPMTCEGIRKLFVAKGIRGIPGSGDGCPIANFIKLKLVDEFKTISVTKADTKIYSVHGNYVEGNPLAISQFIVNFDIGCYPELMNQ